jgi:hypothetical protein
MFSSGIFSALVALRAVSRRETQTKSAFVLEALRWYWSS